MLNNGNESGSVMRAQKASEPEKEPSARVDLLTERQRAYLRLVYQHRSSKEIAAATGGSHRAVDKQLLKAMSVLGVPTRFDAARLMAEHETGVEPLPPANALPSASPTFPLPLPVPTAGAAANTLHWKQVAIWTVIISIATPLGLTAAGMAIVTLLLLLGLKPM
jgi:DNA-binding CsgD family transcriptional regulator